MMTASTPPGTLPRTDMISRAAGRLLSAARTRTPCPPVREFIGAEDAGLAYAVQQMLTTARVSSGARIAGHKIGLTSPAVQAQLGVSQPDFGVLFDDMACPPGSPIDVARLMQPRIEAEVAFVLSGDITGPDVTEATVREAVDFAIPAPEIVDSRIAGWDITFADTVADNASSGLYTLGAARRSLPGFEPVSASMVMTIDGEERSAGTGGACLGDPLRALAWLARTLLDFGDPLRAGQVVLSGALGPMAPVHPGAHVRADISGLGGVEAIFTTSATTEGRA